MNESPKEYHRCDSSLLALDDDMNEGWLQVLIYQEDGVWKMYIEGYSTPITYCPFCSEKL